MTEPLPNAGFASPLGWLATWVASDQVFLLAGGWVLLFAGMVYVLARWYIGVWSSMV